VVGGASIIPSPVVRNLGVLLDSHLTMEQQINTSCRSSYFHLRPIARIKKFLYLPAVIQLVHAFVLFHIDYGNALLVGLPATHLAKLQRVQNSAARLIVRNALAYSFLEKYPPPLFWKQVICLCHSLITFTLRWWSRWLCLSYKTPLIVLLSPVNTGLFTQSSVDSPFRESSFRPLIRPATGLLVPRF
jgi:hypothetical protein